MVDSVTVPVLVTGGCGYVGSHVVVALLDAGYEVCVIDDLSTGLRANVDPRARFYEGSVENHSLVRGVIQMRNVSTVVHLAGIPDAGDSSSRPMDYYRCNVSASRALIESALQCGVRHFVLSSSGEIYGPSGESRIAETTPAVPRTPYAKSEWVKERILVDCADLFWTDYCILRYFDVVGAGPHYRRSSRSLQNNLMVGTILAAIGRGKPLRLAFDSFDTRDGSAEREFIHVRDVAQAHIAAIRKLHAQTGWRAELNCGTGRGATLSEIVSSVEQVTHMKVPSNRREPLPGEAPSLVLDSDAIRRELNWHPEHASTDVLVREAFQAEMSRQKYLRSENAQEGRLEPEY